MVTKTKKIGLLAFTAMMLAMGIPAVYANCDVLLHTWRTDVYTGETARIDTCTVPPGGHGPPPGWWGHGSQWWRYNVQVDTNGWWPGGQAEWECFVDVDDNTVLCFSDERV